MTFKIAIATMDAKVFSNRSHMPTNYLVVNQIKKEANSIAMPHVYNFQESGLSKSRNHALDLCDSDICLISDDDLEYMNGIEDRILDAFERHKDADIITFQIETPEGEPFKTYAKESFWHSKKTLMRVASVEIALKHKSIMDSGLRFDERFGLGSEFPTGEEIIFLTDALEKGLKILYIPIPIVMHPKESSGSNYHNIKLIEAKGAMFYRMFGISGYPISILYAYKKYKQSPFTLNAFRQLMFAGIQNYKKGRK
jgi:glycosyltransferase involved in cell wall biosynthesis